ncbi:MAG: prepilin-type N-terminal cleavage/methylation domain-containing protein [Bacilli bacterium]|nr:prepilin-type N-terminal cleavage/methylation domain-containing protein [Bacilli bacterium]
MLKNKKGFTLVELLAVIVILAIILAIAIPSITGITSTAKKNSFESAVKMLIKGVDYQVLSTPGSTAGTITTAGVTAAGGSTTEFTGYTVTSLSPVTITVAGETGGKFAGCTVTGATSANLVHTGTAGAAGVISGC